jgi:hypothetical protein
MNTMNNRIIVIDTETGGLDETQHSLLSVTCAKITDRWEKIDIRTWFIKQDSYTVTAQALKINQIDLSFADEWTSPNIFLKELLAYLDLPASIANGEENKRNLWRIRGKNPSFDARFLEAFLSKKIYNSIFQHWTECVLQEWYNPLQRLGALPIPAKRDLTSLCKIMKIDVDENKTHSSEYDVEMTIALGRKLIEVEDRVRSLINKARQAHVAR